MALSCVTVLLAALVLLCPAHVYGDGFLTYDTVRGQAYNVSYDGRHVASPLLAGQPVAARRLQRLLTRLVLLAGRSCSTASALFSCLALCTTRA